MLTPAPNLHDISVDPRNAAILISVNGELFPQKKAVVSVFDSGFIMGDGAWEGLRVINGGVPFLREHIKRLYEGTKAIFMDIGLAPNKLVQQIFACIDANKMRITLTVEEYLGWQRSIEKHGLAGLHTTRIQHYRTP